MPVAEKTTIFVTVRSGIATVDAKTVPAGIDVRVLDFDSMEQDAARFESELDSQDIKYLGARHSTVLLDMQDLVADQEDDADEDDDDYEEDDEDLEALGSDDDDDEDYDEDEDDEDDED